METTKGVGIDLVKKALKFGFDVTKQVYVSGADGWQFTDGFAFVDELMQVPGIIKDGKILGIQLKDLDETEREELKTWAAIEFDIPNDDVEEWIEDLLNFAFSILALVNKHRNRNNPEN